MKKFSSYINESTKEFDVEMLHKDYKAAEWATGQEKKDLMEKYGVTSKKKADIQAAILKALQESRKNKKEFSNDDIRDFFRMDGKLENNLKDESIEFAEFLKDFLYEDLKKHKLERFALMKSFSGYRFSNQEKYMMQRYQKVIKHLTEVNPSKEEIDEKAKLEMINTRITELMGDFKVVYMDRVKDYAKKQYSYYANENNLKALKADVKACEKVVENYKKEKNIRWISYHDSIGSAYEKMVEKARKKVNAFNAFNKMYSSEASYVEKCLKDAEQIFASNIRAISERLMKNELDVTNISISDVKNDPKFFEMMLTDGKKKLYLRSVFAAANSVKMIPHFRFIITERK